MEAVDLSLSGLKLLSPKLFRDERGFFKETYRLPLYEGLGVGCRFIQDNHSYSRKGTIRGLHFQRNPGQAKLVSVIVGQILDVAVDVRPESSTFGKWESLLLDGEKGEQLFIPVGFAHGFCVLSEEAHVVYKVSSLYDPQEERGIAFDDPDLNISWPPLDWSLSDRDRRHPSLKELFP